MRADFAGQRQKRFTDDLFQGVSGMSTTSVMVIDDDPQVCRLLGSILENEGANVVLQQSAQQGLSALKSRPVDVLFTDLRVGDGDGLSIISEARKLCPDLSAIVITGYGSVESSVGAFRLGAVDYLTKPFRAEQVTQALARACSRVARSRIGLPGASAASGAAPAAQIIIAQSPAMRAALVLAKRVAQADVPVLVTGEQGVGKELIVRAIFSQSTRSAGPFVKINCGAIQDEQLETIVFGKESSDSAEPARAGALEQAAGGFFFLHNVTELPKWMHAKLFQAIQSGSFCRLGGNQSIPLTARIAASTEKDLSALAASGDFFHELFYYLHVVPVHVPALRERRDDITPLADQFLQESLRSRPAGKPSHRLAFSKEAHRALETYRWPGNVYELSNLVRRAVVFASGPEITAGEMAELFPPPAATDAVETITIPYASDLKVIERSIVSEVINRHNGNKSAAARALGLHRKTLYRILEDERHGGPVVPAIQG
jgi:DNA-binding NtrC family response regulator